MTNDIYQKSLQLTHNHTYKLLEKNDNSEIWECKQENKNTYSFIIYILKGCILVKGDIGTLLFEGISDINLLSDHTEYDYIFSKLNEGFKEYDFDNISFNNTIKEQIINLLENEEEMFFDEEKYNEVYNNITSLSLEEIIIYLEKNWTLNKKLNLFSRKIIDALKHSNITENVLSINNNEEAIEFFKLNEVFKKEDYYEYDFRHISKGLLLRIFMITNASKEIIKLK